MAQRRRVAQEGSAASVDEAVIEARRLLGLRNALELPRLELECVVLCFLHLLDFPVAGCELRLPAFPSP